VPAAAAQRVREGSWASQTVPTHGIAGNPGAGRQKVGCVSGLLCSFGIQNWK
jgi:hypothetical protein